MPKSCVACTNGCGNYVEALYSSQKYDNDALKQKICGVIELIATLKEQVSQDIASNATLPSGITILAATQVINTLDSISEVALLDNASPPVTVASADLAFIFGLNMEINCQFVKVLLRSCYINDENTGITAGLGWLSNDASTYATASSPSPFQFVCCLLEVFTKIKLFLDKYKKCESSSDSDLDSECKHHCHCKHHH